MRYYIGSVRHAKKRGASPVRLTGGKQGEQGLKNYLGSLENRVTIKRGLTSKRWGGGGFCSFGYHTKKEFLHLVKTYCLGSIPAG